MAHGSFPGRNPTPSSFRERERLINQLQADPVFRVAWEMNQLVEHGYCTPMGGNVSMRLSNGIMAVTPAHVDKRLLLPDDIVYVNIASGNYDGGPKHRQPTSETDLHREIYQQTEAAAIVHAHPRSTVFLAQLDGNMGQQLINALSTGVPEYAVSWATDEGDAKASVTKEYEMMWSKELARQVATEFAQGKTIVVMRNHGPIAIGATMTQAVEQIMLLEELCSHALLKAMFGQQLLHTEAIPEQLRGNLVTAGTSYLKMVNEGNK
ncbi:class II aldolase/adducin family protein [Patescibacteria group bacterium]|nr:class II aldolase/adducin family protein [Patescibacteria group bacterium]MCL5091947.1 class II aldolase/adducin family protein [Patescibacteria group bacterium]